MEFIEINEEKKSEWNDFILQNSPESFLQSYEWGEFQKAAGHKVFRYAVCEGEDILALSLVVEHKLPLGFRYWYIPRGPVTYADINTEKQKEVLESLLANIESKARGSKIIFVRMDPAWEKDEDGKGISGNINLVKMDGIVQPKDSLVIDLGKTEDEILSGMKPKTRYNIRLAEKKGVIVSAENFSEENFEKFWQLIRETSERDGIVSHSREYYYQMLKVLSGGEDRSSLKGLLYFARFEGRIIAANAVLQFGPYAVYLHGASSNSDRNLMAPYLLQWQQIKDAKNAECRIYDFWGITVGNENPRWEGITRFKKGFGGREIRYAGVYDLPVNATTYNIYSRIRKV